MEGGRISHYIANADEEKEHLEKAMRKKIKNSGIDAILETSWGTHLCLFYENVEDTIEVIESYISAGIAENDACLVALPDMNVAKHLENVLRKKNSGIRQSIESGQREILPNDAFHQEDGDFDSQLAIANLTDRLTNAVKNGFDGFGLAFVADPIEKTIYERPFELDEHLHNIMQKCRIIALCAYPISQCGVLETIDIISNHYAHTSTSGHEIV